MKRKINIIYSVLLCCMSFVWVSCNKEDIDDSKHVSITQSNITFLASERGAELPQQGGHDPTDDRP